MADTCQDEREKHEELFKEWEECWDEVGELQETGLQMDAAMGLACGGAIAATLAGPLAFGFAGGACALAFWALADAIDDLYDHYDKCNEMALDVNASGAKWRECAEEHKNDP
jgi:ferric-dicitrate binding protein FerR (iron transport regulator)